MFGSEYWWAGLLVFIGFIGLNVGVVFLRKKPALSYAIAYTIAIYLFVFKVTEYSYHQIVGEHWKFPMELSAMSYVFYSIFVVFRIRKADVFGAFLGVLAGAVYSAAWWISPESFVNNHEPAFWTYSALVNHHLVYLGGILMMANVRRYRYSTAWIHAVGVGVLVAYSWVIYLFTPYAQYNGADSDPVIIQITNASVLSHVVSCEITTGIKVSYYIVAIILVVGLNLGSLFLSNVMANKRKKWGVEEDYFPETLKATYKIK